MHFNYNHLRVFREVMIHGSATRAALEVNITQSSVSRILKEFEESVGFRLFDRERTGLRPTREAQKLFKDVQRAYATFTDVKQTAQSILNKEVHVALFNSDAFNAVAVGVGEGGNGQVAFIGDDQVAIGDVRANETEITDLILIVVGLGG